MIIRYEGILAVDPGMTATGWSIYRDGRLQACGILRADSPNPVENMKKICYGLKTAWEEHMSGTRPPEYMVVEKMQVYRQGLAKGDPNDLIDLSILGGALWTSIQPKAVSFPVPRQWKGQVPKDVLIQRVIKELSKQEETILRSDVDHVPSGLRHNVYDAVCLGKWALKRFKK